MILKRPLAIAIIMVTFSPCRGMETGQEISDPFIRRVQELCQLSLTSENLTKELDGYSLVPFSGEQKNRNHFDDRPQGSLTPIKSIVMHYTVSNFTRTMDLFTKDIPDGRVSSSYVISETDESLDIPGGKVIRIAPDDKRTWHAGVSQWREIVNLNGVSLGIENVNKGFIDAQDKERAWFPFDHQQVHALGLLSQALIKEYHIAPSYIVGHADIAPDRKQDPGILFPWERLYHVYDVGAWLTKEELDTSTINQRYVPKEPLPKGVSVEFLSTQLNRYGYKVEPTSMATGQFLDVLKAFKSHFSSNMEPHMYNSQPDEKDMLWVWGLNAKYPT